jgi:hypothetical protein
MDKEGERNSPICLTAQDRLKCCKNRVKKNVDALFSVIPAHNRKSVHVGISGMKYDEILQLRST